MPQITPAVIAGIGVAVSAVGTGAAIYGQIQATKASKKAERLRKRQMELEAARKRRQAAREAAIARSRAVSNAAGQDAMSGSGLAGGLAQVSGHTGASILNINQSTEIGGRIFDANASLASARGFEATGEGISSLGGGIFNNSETIFKVGASYNLWGNTNS